MVLRLLWPRRRFVLFVPTHSNTTSSSHICFLICTACKHYTLITIIIIDDDVVGNEMEKSESREEHARFDSLRAHDALRKSSNVRAPGIFECNNFKYILHTDVRSRSMILKVCKSSCSV